MRHEDKKSLRKEVLSQLENLTVKEKSAIEARLYDYLFTSSFWNKANCIGVTASTKIEWNTEPIMERAWQEGKVVAVPKTIPAHARMDFYQIDNVDELKPGYQNIFEPLVNETKYMNKEIIDLLIVPGVVFDQYGYRIGFGGGYYDRFLSDYKGETVSLLSRIQLVHKLPIEKHDIHVQYLITEAGIRKINDKSEV